MASLTFPLGLSDFANGLQLESLKFYPVDPVEISGQGTGQMIASNPRPSYWAADIVIRPLYSGAARALQALIHSLDGGLNDFYLYDPVSAFPIADPGGSILGGAAVTNSLVAGNGKQMKFSGLPAHYVLSPGDRFSFDYGSGIYRALHEIVAGDTADGSGNTDFIEFRPRLDDPSVATGKPMNFRKASCRMKIVQESINYGERKDVFTSGMAFSCEQVP